jgi:thioredoxin-related protein
MKGILLISIFIVSANIAANAQNTVISGPTAKPGVDKTAPAGFVREKFDPTRDPKADLDAAIKTASGSGKRIILDVGGEWCSWCVYMDRFFYENADINRLREVNYVWVKINYSDTNENKEFLSAYPEIKGYPHLYVLDAAGKLLISQDTSPLEAGKGYDLAKFTEFLRTWVPKRSESAAISQ